MGTRSAIGYKTPEGKIRAKYSHYDGYVAGAGKTLQEHYTQARKIAQMVELGDQSYMDKEIFPMPGSGHSFNTPEEGVTIFYGRDRGETGQEFKVFSTLAKAQDYFEGSWCEYLYVFKYKKSDDYQSGEWHFKKPGGRWKKLAPALAKLKAEECA